MPVNFLAKKFQKSFKTSSLGTLFSQALLITLVASGAFAPKIHALTINSTQDLAIDTSIIKEDTAFTAPSKIVVVPINLADSNANISGRDWARGLYYYMVANESRPGFTDIPFHYIVTSDGIVAKGNQGGEERKVVIEGVSGNPIVVAYLSDRRQINFDVRAESALTDLLLQVANRNSINPNNIEISGLTLTRNDTEKIIKLQSATAIGSWQTGLNRIVNNIRPNYRPEPRQFNLEIESVTLPTEGVNPGNAVVGKIKIKNNSDKGIYAQTPTELVATATNVSRQSKFFITGEWASTTQFSFMPEESSIPAGGSAEFEFKFYVPLFFGRQEEQFELRTLGGQVVANTRFTAGLTVNRPEGTIVEIRPTPVGFLRLRSAPNGLVNNEIGRVSQGERYFQISDAGNGYIQIRLPDGRTGWVSKGYVSYI